MNTEPPYIAMSKTALASNNGLASPSGDIPEGYKRCPTCPEGQQWHPATPEFFHRDGKRLCFLCKTCNNKRIEKNKRIREEKRRKADQSHQDAEGHTIEVIQSEPISMDEEVQYIAMNGATPSHAHFLESVPEGHKRCSRCKHPFPATLKYFSPSKSRPDGLYSMCRKCKNESWRACEIRRKERDKSNGHTVIKSPGTPDQCGSCGTVRGNIFGDVDGSTFEKYGYLCMRCHQLVRDFGGDPERIRLVLDYIERTRRKKKKPATPKS